MPRGRKSKLRARERRQRARAEARARAAQAAAGAEGLAVGPLSVSGDSLPGARSRASELAERARGQAPKSPTYPWAGAAAEGAGQALLAQKAGALVEYLLDRHRAGAPIRRDDMLRLVHRRHRKAFPAILARARERMQLLFGLELQEALPGGGTYLLVDRRGGAHGLPGRGLLMPLLSVILLKGDCASEEEIWAFLGAMGVCDGGSDLVFGEPRQRVTRALVRERYLEHRQVPLSEPPRFELRWGPRAQAETSRMKALEFLARLTDMAPAAFAPRHEEALREEEEEEEDEEEEEEEEEEEKEEEKEEKEKEEKRGRGAPRARALLPAAKAGGRPGAAPRRSPHPK